MRRLVGGYRITGAFGAGGGDPVKEYAAPIAAAACALVFFWLAWRAALREFGGRETGDRD